MCFVLLLTGYWRDIEVCQWADILLTGNIHSQDLLNIACVQCT